jgi:hypothetical protein
MVTYLLGDWDVKVKGKRQITPTMLLAGLALRADLPTSPVFLEEVF